MKEQDRVLSVAEMGTPTILIERISSTDEMHHCVTAYHALVGSPEYNVKTGYLETTGNFSLFSKTTEPKKLSEYQNLELHIAWLF